MEVNNQQKNKIWLSPPHMSGEEQVYIQQAFDTNWVAPLGPNVTAFEKDLENYLSDNTRVAVLSSGTAAMHLALIQLGVKSDDSVLCQTFTFSASANPITYLGAKPIFIDSETDTWNMCPIILEDAIKAEMTLGKKPKAIIVVHLYGMPSKIKEILEIAQRYEIPLIEDAAEAIGSHVNGKKLGTYGYFSILSFNGNKIITTSGGGALVSKSDDEYLKTIYLSTQSREISPHYEHREIGYNYRMSNILAGIGRGQMQVLQDRINARRNNFNFYQSKLSGKGISFLKEPNGYFSNRWLTTILTNDFEQREKIRLVLENNNIECRPLWKPMHLQPVFQDCKVYENGVSEDLFNRGLCLPSGSSLTQDDLERIVLMIESVL